MGIIIKSLIDDERGVSLSECYARVSDIYVRRAPPEGEYEVVGLVQLFANKSARETNKKMVKEHSLNARTQGVPANVYETVYSKLKIMYPEYVDDI